MADYSNVSKVRWSCLGAVVIAELLDSRTYLPEEPARMTALANLLEMGGSHFLVSVGEDQQIALPEVLHKVLAQVVAAMQAGRAVTVSPTPVKVTTQQVADLLGVSRPTVVRLIDAGELASERIGNRRRVLLKDALYYRELRRTRGFQAVADTSPDEDDPEAVKESLARIRRQRAAHRRSARGL